MDPVKELKRIGFQEVIILDYGAGSLLLAIWPYRAEKPGIPSDPAEVRIHPYYDASQKAYRTAVRFVQACRDAGFPIALRDDIRLIPIFSGLKRFRTGRNTLHYLQGYGSRFHVQTFLSDLRLPATDVPEPEPLPRSCGACRICRDRCPTGAIGEDGLCLERCIRYWMLNGRPAPDEIREAMGDRFLGCDECQICCPMNPAPDGAPNERVSLKMLLNGTANLDDRVGRNLTIRNRMLAQACLNAGCGNPALFEEELTRLAESPSEAVRAHARWALERVGSGKNSSPGEGRKDGDSDAAEKHGQTADGQ